MSPKKNKAKLTTLKNGTKAKTRTNGRGVTRVWEGTILACVKSGEIAPKKYHKLLPHGDKASNRPRYVLDCGAGAGIVWANVKTTVAANEDLPPHKPRLSKPAKAKKSKAKKAKIKVVVKKSDRMAQPKAATPKKRVETPKKTWYGIVDGKVVSVRKVICPDGFSDAKPTEAPAATEAPSLPQAEAPASA